MGIIKAAKLAFDYLRYGEEGEEPEVNRAIDQVDLDIQEGQFIAILGHNGSGKSTLAKHINGLLVPTVGGPDGYLFSERYLGNPTESRNGFSESGQSDHRYGCGRGRRIWTGKSGSANGRYLETGG